MKMKLAVFFCFLYIFNCLTCLTSLMRCLWRFLFVQVIAMQGGFVLPIGLVEDIWPLIQEICSASISRGFSREGSFLSLICKTEHTSLKTTMNMQGRQINWKRSKGSQIEKPAMTINTVASLPRKFQNPSHRLLTPKLGKKQVWEEELDQRRLKYGWEWWCGGGCRCTEGSDCWWPWVRSRILYITLKWSVCHMGVYMTNRREVS